MAQAIQSLSNTVYRKINHNERLDILSALSDLIPDKIRVSTNDAKRIFSLLFDCTNYYYGNKLFKTINQVQIQRFATILSSNLSRIVNVADHNSTTLLTLTQTLTYYLGIIKTIDKTDEVIANKVITALTAMVQDLTILEPEQYKAIMIILGNIKSIQADDTHAKSVFDSLKSFYTNFINKRKDELLAHASNSDKQIAIRAGSIAFELLSHRVSDAEQRILIEIITQVLLHKESEVVTEFLKKIATANTQFQQSIFNGVTAKLQAMVVPPAGTSIEPANAIAAINYAYALLNASVNIANLQMGFGLYEVIRIAGLSNDVEVRNHSIKKIVELMKHPNTLISLNGMNIAAFVISRFHPNSVEAKTLITNLNTDYAIDHCISAMKILPPGDHATEEASYPFIATLGSICNYLFDTEPRYLKIVNHLATLPTFGFILGYLDSKEKFPQAFNALLQVIPHLSPTPQRKDHIIKLLNSINFLADQDKNDRLIVYGLNSLGRVLKIGKPTKDEISLITGFYRDFITKRRLTDPENSRWAAFYLSSVMSLLEFDTPGDHECSILTTLSDFVVNTKDDTTNTSLQSIQGLTGAIANIKSLDHAKALGLIAELSKVVDTHKKTEGLINSVEELHIEIEKLKNRLKLGVAVTPSGPPSLIVTPAAKPTAKLVSITPAAPLPQLISLPPGSPAATLFSLPAQKPAPKLVSLSPGSEEPKVTVTPAKKPAQKPGSAPVVSVDSGSFSPLFREQVRNQAAQSFPTLGVPTPGPISDASFKAIGEVIANKIKDFQASSDAFSAAGIKAKEEREMFQNLEIQADNPITPKIFEIVRKDTSTAAATSYGVKEKLIKIDHDDRSVRIASETPHPKDDALFMMLLSAKAAADRLGKKNFNIEQCEEPVNAPNAFRLYLLGKSMGLNPKFKDRHGMPSTENSILNSEFGKTKIEVNYKGVQQQLTVADVFLIVKSLKVDDPTDMKEIKSLVHSLEVQEDALQYIRGPTAPKV